MRMLAAALALAGVVPLAQAQSKLVEKAGCGACHGVDEKLIGPAYRDVAARYRDDPKAADTLFDKVRDGGSGAWGETPMPPQDEERISDAELKVLIGWVLQQK